MVVDKEAVLKQLREYRDELVSEDDRLVKAQLKGSLYLVLTALIALFELAIEKEDK